MDEKIIVKHDPLEKAVIKHVDDVSVSSNELNLSHVMNRNFLKLLENDMAIGSLTENVRNGLYRIMPYIEGHTYSKNDIVFFVDTYPIPTLSSEWYGVYDEAGVKIKSGKLDAFKAIAVADEIEVEDVSGYEEEWMKYHTTALFLLRSTRNNNTTRPKREYIDLQMRFDVSGWVNENPMGTIYYDYFDEYLRVILARKIKSLHEDDRNFHKFGTLSAYEEMNDKILRTDLSNIDPDRVGFHFPGHTYTVPETNTILGGQCRKWDCGLLEYYLEFKLGTDSEVLDSYNEDGSVRRLDQIDANYLNLKRKTVVLDDELVYDNSPYYLTEEDADIFKISGGKTRAMNSIVQVNTNTKINALQGTLRFPEPFINTEYAIFLQSPPCVCVEGSVEIEQNVNQMVFVNKARRSVTALLIIPTYEGTEPKLLYTNRFKVQIIGRWKKTPEERLAEIMAAQNKAIVDNL